MGDFQSNRELCDRKEEIDSQTTEELGYRI